VKKVGVQVDSKKLEPWLKTKKVKSTCPGCKQEEMVSERYNRRPPFFCNRPRGSQLPTGPTYMRPLCICSPFAGVPAGLLWVATLGYQDVMARSF